MHQVLACTVDAAFNGADRALKMIRSFLVAASVNEDELESAPIFLRQAHTGRFQFMTSNAPFLVRLNAFPRGHAFQRPDRFPSCHSIARAEGVAHDCEEPGFEPGPLFITVQVNKCADQRFLNQIIGIGGVPIKVLANARNAGIRLTISRRTDSVELYTSMAFPWRYMKEKD